MIKYTKDHEWVKVEGDVATIGITQHAADALGELVYVELPKVGNKYNKGDAAVVVESSKSASDVYTPVAGEIVAVNDSLVANPENVNNDTNGAGWLIKIKMSNPSDLSDAMDEAGYQKYLSENN
ncbi:MAG: gcvH [Rickettsiaceae bacterium]|jgi:glycine cleavage system H protein|nr:gcvH [Rickettsiaceae bacterium]